MDALYEFLYNQNSLCASFKIKFVPVASGCAFSICFTARIMWRKTNAQKFMRCEKFFRLQLFRAGVFFFLFSPLPFSQSFTHWPAVNHSMELASRKTGPTIFLAARLSVSFLFLSFAKWGATKRMTNRFFSKRKSVRWKEKARKKCRNFHKIRITAVILYGERPAPRPLRQTNAEIYEQQASKKKKHIYMYVCRAKEQNRKQEKQSETAE